MTRRSYTIGQIARLSGVPVRRLRFYESKGLLAPADRAQSGYRLFDDADLIRINLISVLRGAGLSLEAIREVLAKRSSISDVLTMRLAAIEAQVDSLHRVAVAIRVALRSPEPTNDDLRRIWMTMNLSQAERSAAIQRFFDKVVAGAELDPKWKDRMIRMSTPDLPGNPTGEQVEAWLELSKLIDDPKFVAVMRENAQDAFGSMDAEIFREVETAITARARDAMSRGLDPDSDAGRAVAQEYLKGWARAREVAPDDEYLARIRRKHLSHRQNLRRYWELVAKVGGLMQASRAVSPPSAEWMWIDKATMLWLAKNQAWQA